MWTIINVSFVSQSIIIHSIVLLIMLGGKQSPPCLKNKVRHIWSPSIIIHASITMYHTDCCIKYGLLCCQWSKELAVPLTSFSFDCRDLSSGSLFTLDSASLLGLPSSISLWVSDTICDAGPSACLYLTCTIHLHGSNSKSFQVSVAHILYACNLDTKTHETSGVTAKCVHQGSEE